MSQLEFDLRSRASARASDPLPSHLAADEIEASGKADHQRAIAYTLVTLYPNSTSAELAEVGDLDRWQMARRLPELRKDGHVKNGQQRICRISGRLAITWSPV